MLYKWFNERLSELKYIGNRLVIVKQFQINKNIAINYKGEDSIIVGDFILRFKASGGKVKSCWKINYELNR